MSDKAFESMVMAEGGLANVLTDFIKLAYAAELSNNSIADRILDILCDASDRQIIVDSYSLRE